MGGGRLTDHPPEAAYAAVNSGDCIRQGHVFGKGGGAIGHSGGERGSLGGKIGFLWVFAGVSGCGTWCFQVFLGVCVGGIGAFWGSFSVGNVWK